MIKNIFSVRAILAADANRGRPQMPYAPEHKELTHARIVECARRMFNRHGFEAVSIDQIMASAGLTRGGFYHHFANKEALYSEAIASYARCGGAVPVDFTSSARQVVLQMIGAYLSHQHLENLDDHCPMIALPSDVARAGPVVRRTYQQLLAGMIAMFERGIEPADRDARQVALAIAALCVGAMVLARTIEDADLAAEIREAARALALDVAGFNGTAAAA
jgi:TetR/AcrR family transcriptional regulator, transcriptional repressor for nem operon